MARVCKPVQSGSGRRDAGGEEQAAPCGLGEEACAVSVHEGDGPVTQEEGSLCPPPCQASGVRGSPEGSLI